MKSLNIQQTILFDEEKYVLKMKLKRTFLYLQINIGICLFYC